MNLSRSEFSSHSHELTQDEGGELKKMERSSWNYEWLPW